MQGYFQQGLGPQVCMCGFVYPWKSQKDWTAEEARSVAEHQQWHLESQIRGAAEPPGGE